MMIASANRRQLLKSLVATGAAAATLPAPLLAQGKGPRVVVIGGGFGGTSCARALRTADPRITVTLIETHSTYTAPPMSNGVIAGLFDLKHQEFGYDAVGRLGVSVIHSEVTAVDPSRRSVTVADGSRFAYDRLVISPGIDFRWEAIAGYDRAAASVMPHAWADGDQVALLRRQLQAMDDGGTVVMTVPVNPARCPPAPYERASLIAHYLKTKKPRSKVIVLDAKDSFTMQNLFQAAWAELYPGLIEWVPLSSGGAPTSVDPASRTIKTDFDSYRAAVANVIPPQRAGHLAELAGAADRTGWCPVDPITFESRLEPRIHVIGDAALAGAMPRSASAAHSQGQICARAIAADFAGRAPALPTLDSACYSLIAPDYAISQRGIYRPEHGQ